MTGAEPVRLIATCWTTAGDAAPQRGDERSPIELRERIETAAAAGWTGFGLLHADLIAYRDSRGGLAELSAILRDNGMSQVELEFLGEWWTADGRRAASDRVRADLLSAARELGARTVKIAAEIGDAPVDHGMFLAEFDALATQALEHGTRVALEPMPFSSNVPTVDAGAAILREIANPGAGLCVDIWHVYRAGTPYSAVAALPAEMIFVVELDDGTAAPVGSLWDDTIDRRRYPGRGAFDVPGFVRAVRESGYDGGWGVEIISAEHRARPIAESLPQLASETRALLAEPVGSTH
ncbi:sugar phosphate isomerase/epimerase family protein [Herbiconiux sp. 11R-BC]|uniref:sugar phosphate isomerase/epimerase family protein n=1 Tax=Herbiconiux sp. 11R-BC TaxID=3111637 RepID=UPI003C034E17